MNLYGTEDRIPYARGSKVQTASKCGLKSCRETVVTAATAAAMAAAMAVVKGCSDDKP